MPHVLVIAEQVERKSAIWLENTSIPRDKTLELDEWHHHECPDDAG
jgi:hypothetical protein